MRKNIAILFLCIVICLTGCQKKSENYIEPLKNEHITKKDSVQYLSNDCIGYIEKLIPNMIEWYNTIDESQYIYKKTYGDYEVTKGKEDIIIPLDLYVSDEMYDLSIKIADSVEDDMKKIDKKSFKIAENILPANQPVISLSMMELSGEALMTMPLVVSIPRKSMSYYTISKDSWLKIRSEILEAKSFYYDE